MKKLVVKNFFDKTVQTKWAVESFGWLYIFIHPTQEIYNELFYWRLDDPEGRYLLSMDISDDGYIRKIEIISYNGKITSISNKTKGDSVVKKEGYVQVNTDMWENQKTEFQKKAGVSINPIDMHFSENYKFIDNPEAFCLQINETNLRIELFKSTVTQEVWISESLCLELNKMNEICAFLVKDFIGEDREKILWKSRLKFIGL